MNVKDSKGSITIFVIVGMLFMTTFLIISFGNNINKSKIAKEQFNTISGIYSHGDGEQNAYNRAYLELRDKNKTSKTATATDSKILELKESNYPYGEEINVFKVYGTSSGLGTQQYDYDQRKYIQIVKIKVSNKAGNYSKEYSIKLENKLYSGEYIDYKQKCVYQEVTVDGAKKTEVKEYLKDLESIYLYDDYTEIEVIEGGIPSKIEVTYTGYTLD